MFTKDTNERGGVGKPPLTLWALAKFPARSLLTSLTLVASALCQPAVASEDGTPGDPVAPDRKEIWVPTDKLGEILKRDPKAVMLSREQYDTLLRDAGHVDPKKSEPPRTAALSVANYHARVDGQVLRVDAEWTVQVLSERWAELPLEFGDVTLGSVQVDGDAALLGPELRTSPVHANQNALAPGGKAGSLVLLLRGRGEHKIGLSFTTSIITQGGGSRVRVALPAAGSGSFQTDLPAHSRVEGSQPIRIETLPEATRVTAAIAPAQPSLELNWRAAAEAANSLPANATVHVVHTADAEKLRTDCDFKLSTPMGALPPTLKIAVPAECTVLEVSSDGLANWNAEAGAVTITLQPGEHRDFAFHLALQQPSLGSKDQADRELPLPRIEGLPRLSGDLSVQADAGVEVREMTVDRPAQALGPAEPFFGRWAFSDAPHSAHATFRKLEPRFFADLDTVVEFKRDAIYLERTVTLHEEKGQMFSLQIDVPAGEEVLSVKAGEHEADWRLEGRRLRLRWSDVCAADTLRSFVIHTRTEPANWMQAAAIAAAKPAANAQPQAAVPEAQNATKLAAAATTQAHPTADGFAFTLGDAAIIGAQNVSGYIALRGDESFRLEAQPSDTLESRDARTAPVHGDYAWFRRDHFTLGVKIARRPSEILANVTGYALPLEGVLDLHAQIAWEFRHSGVRTVRVRVPKEMASQFYFDAPEIAERSLTDDVWTLTFQKEITGPFTVAVTAQTPIQYERTGENSSRFQVAVPVVEPLGTQRVSGVWAVEANTETEIQIASKEMNELDALAAPTLPGFQPTHRVIGVFGWIGPSYKLTLTGVRHAPARILTTVADSMEIDSVVSPSGGVRTQAALQMRTAGAQFLDVALPEGARLLSVAVDDQAVKPVEGVAGQVRVQLPAKTDIGTEITLLYENPEAEWRGAGTVAVLAPRLAREIPVLKSTWHLYLPNGYRYSGFESNLRTPQEKPDPLFIMQSAKSIAAIPASLLFPRSSFTRRLRATSGTIATQYVDVADERWNVQRIKAEFTAPPLPEEISAKAMSELEGRLNAIVLPAFDLNQTSLREAVNILQSKTNVPIELKNLPPEALAYKIALHLTEIPLGEVLKYVASLSGLKCSMEGNRVVLSTGDRHLTPEIYRKSWILPRAVAAQFSAALPGHGTGAPTSIQTVLETWGIPFPPGCKAAYFASSRELVVQNMRVNLELVDAMVGEPSGKVAESLSGADVASAAKTAAIEQKLRSIVIPNLEFRETTVREAFDYLKRKSVELDPEHQGINIVLKLDIPYFSSVPPVAPATPGIQPPTIPGLEPAPTSPANGEVPIQPGDAKLTISLSKIPLGEALKYVAALSNLKTKIEPYAIAIVPLSTPTETLLNRVWRVPPGLFAGPQDELGQNSVLGQNPTSGGSGLIARATAMDFLAASGVTFPPGASAIFLPSRGVLVIKDTQENLDLVDAIVEAAAVAPQPAAASRPQPERVVGLLPIKLELPKAGTEITLDGLVAPDRVTFHYHDAWSRARALWWWLVAGGLAFFFVGRGRHWWKALWAILILTAIPVCLSPAWTGICNALLAGWLLALVLQRIGARLARAPRRKEALA